LSYPLGCDFQWVQCSRLQELHLHKDFSKFFFTNPGSPDVIAPFFLNQCRDDTALWTKSGRRYAELPFKQFFIINNVALTLIASRAFQQGIHICDYGRCEFSKGRKPLQQFG